MGVPQFVSDLQADEAAINQVISELTTDGVPDNPALAPFVAGFSGALETVKNQIGWSMTAYAASLGANAPPVLLLTGPPTPGATPPLALVLNGDQYDEVPDAPVDPATIPAVLTAPSTPPTQVAPPAG